MGVQLPLPAPLLVIYFESVKNQSFRAMKARSSSFGTDTVQCASIFI